VIRLAFGNIHRAAIYQPATDECELDSVEKPLRATGLANAGAGFGGAVSPMLFSWMISRYGWRTSFLLAGIATAILGVFWFLLVRDHPPGSMAAEQAPARVRFPWRALLTDRNVALLTFGFSTLGYFEYIFFYWIYYYLGEIATRPSSECKIYTVMFLVGWWRISRDSNRSSRKRCIRIAERGESEGEQGHIPIGKQGSPRETHPSRRLLRRHTPRRMVANKQEPEHTKDSRGNAGQKERCTPSIARDHPGKQHRRNRAAEPRSGVGKSGRRERFSTESSSHSSGCRLGIAAR